MGKILCVSNQKGGVGKTTTTNALAMGLRRMGHRVLCVDFDPQGNLSFSLAADARVELQTSIYHVLKGELRAIQTIQHTPLCDVIPANMLLSGIDLEFTGKGREYLLRDSLRPIRGMYDYILIDSPPALGILTVNAFTAADWVLMPVLSDLYSLQGIVQLNETLQAVRSKSNPDVKVAGILLTRFNPRECISSVIRETSADIARELDIPLLDTCIHTGVALTRAQIMRADMTTMAPRSRAVKDYADLLDELFRREVL
ncbi:MAG: chromosome partitioning protein [Clostridiales bacterium]|jgi:chromosome partitioning protein|nr:chromosome partitioning protein [Clostridiales bacterium]